MRYTATVFRPRTGIVTGALAALIALLALVGLAIELPLEQWLRLAPALTLIGAAGVALFWLPSLTVTEDAITVRNVFSTAIVPWSAVVRVDTKYALELTTTEGKISVWAAPSPGRHSAFVTRTHEVERAAKSGLAYPRPGDLESTASGAPATVIRATLSDAIESGGFAAVEPVVRKRHWITLAILGALAVAVVVTVLL